MLMGSGLVNEGRVMLMKVGSCRATLRNLTVMIMAIRLALSKTIDKTFLKVGNDG